MLPGFVCSERNVSNFPRTPIKQLWSYKGYLWLPSVHLTVTVIIFIIKVFYFILVVNISRLQQKLLFDGWPWPVAPRPGRRVVLLTRKILGLQYGMHECSTVPFSNRIFNNYPSMGQDLQAEGMIIKQAWLCMKNAKCRACLPRQRRWMGLQQHSWGLESFAGFPVSGVLQGVHSAIQHDNIFDSLSRNNFHNIASWQMLPTIGFVRHSSSWKLTTVECTKPKGHYIIL